ncbi:DUF6894 family protein [Salinarimonas sp.]|uniref:DUF6894 family protein n=1 Tax=Salinarimonas sp. TaxID=2766526 RepID=UPI0032D99B4C
MPRYFFDLVRNGEIIRDSSGVDLANDDAARRIAREAIDDFRLEDAALALDGWRLVVTDETGRFVADIAVLKMYS